MTKEYKYDVAFSFAGEDREYVDQVAEILKANDIKVFYDKFEEVNMWGKDLGIHFEYVYRSSAKFCIPFISTNYEKKIWTNYEIRNAISRAIETNEEYILPARFDDTQIAGLRPSVSYIDLRNYSPNQFAQLIMNKLDMGDNAPIIQKDQENVANIYLSNNLMLSDFQGFVGVTLGVSITNLTREYRYYLQPYFKTSIGIEGDHDTFILTGLIERVNFPLKMEWGQQQTLNYKLALAGIAQWRNLPPDTTIIAIVTTTIGEKFESNPVKLGDITKNLK